jgi:hypothetical protein
MKAKIKFWQEFQPDGSIADSWIRLLSMLSFILLCAYLYYSMNWYKETFNIYTNLIKSKPSSISEQTYVALTMQLKQVDTTIFFILVALTAAPKVIQKAIEAWSNGKLGNISSSKEVTKETIKETNNADNTNT